VPKRFGELTIVVEQLAEQLDCPKRLVLAVLQSLVSHDISAMSPTDVPVKTLRFQMEREHVGKKMT
jgi:hypothetical protein